MLGALFTFFLKTGLQHAKINLCQTECRMTFVATLVLKAPIKF